MILPVVGDILSICQLVSKGIEDIISGDHNVESTFTQHTISQLGSQYPGKNLLVYHDQDSIVNLCMSCLLALRSIWGWLPSAPDAVHAHYELPLPPTFVGLTQGYEIWVFDSGTFSLAGDGGYENWAVGGCFSRQGNNVVFTQCSWKHAKYISSFPMQHFLRLIFYLCYGYIMDVFCSSSCTGLNTTIKEYVCYWLWK